jgi:hypothetical protein
VVVADPELDQERRGRVEHPLLGPVVVGPLLARVLLAVQQQLALLRVPQPQRLAGRLHVPVPVRRAQQLVDHRARLRAVGGCVPGVRLPLVELGDLQVTAALEVDVPQLDPVVRRCFRTPAPPGSDRAHQRLPAE